ncbi:MAG TPA: M48 family metallopeptidase [Phenylobacterium sp.]|jgi:predicted Zn-dependent protease
MNDIQRIGRRGLLTGAAALAASPALAQLPDLRSLPGMGNLPPGMSKAADLVGQAANVISGMKLTEADELAMGENYYEPFIEESGGRYNSRRAQEALRRFAQPVIGTTRRSGLPWDIVLIDNETINAWALPSGKIGLHSGLVRYCASPEELAAVISHEHGHAELSHGIAQIKNKKFVEGMGGIAKQQIVEKVGQGRTGAVGAYFTGEVLTAFQGPIYNMITGGYSQDLEYAADGHIVGIFDALGYDNGHATDFFNTMLRLIPPNTKATTSLYSTHPGTKDRIKRLQKLAQADKAAKGASAGHPGWAELKQEFPTRTVFRLT